MQKFGLITYERSGTHMLWSVLEQHPCVDFFRYWYDTAEPIAQESAGIRRSASRNWHHQKWLKFLESNPGGVTHLCTWLHYPNYFWVERNTPFTLTSFWQFLGETHQQIVVVSRENVLRQFLSKKVAEQINKFSPGTPRSGVPERIYVKIREFEIFIGLYWNATASLQKVFGDKYVGITYEDLLLEVDDGFGQLQTGLGVSQVDIAACTYKQEDRPICEIVSNYRELEGWLARLDRSRWLEN